MVTPERRRFLTWNSLTRASQLKVKMQQGPPGPQHQGSAHSINAGSPERCFTGIAGNKALGIAGTTNFRIATALTSRWDDRSSGLATLPTALWSRPVVFSGSGHSISICWYCRRRTCFGIADSSSHFLRVLGHRAWGRWTYSSRLGLGRNVTSLIESLNDAAV